MKNKIKNLIWMLPVLMGTSSVFAVFYTPPTMGEISYDVVRFLVMPIFLLMGLIVWFINKNQLNRLDNDGKRELYFYEDKLRALNFSRQKNQKINKMIFGGVGALLIFIILITVIFPLMSTIFSKGYSNSITDFDRALNFFIRDYVTDFTFILFIIVALYSAYSWLYHFMEKVEVKKILYGLNAPKYIYKLIKRRRLGSTLKYFNIALILSFLLLWVNVFLTNY